MTRLVFENEFLRAFPVWISFGSLQNRDAIGVSIHLRRGFVPKHRCFGSVTISSVYRFALIEGNAKRLQHESNTTASFC